MQPIFYYNTRYVKNKINADIVTNQLLKKKFTQKHMKKRSTYIRYMFDRLKF